MFIRLKQEPAPGNKLYHIVIVCNYAVQPTSMQITTTSSNAVADF